MPQLTPTLQHLHQNRNFSDGNWVVPAWALSHPTFVPRLSFKGSPKLPANYRSLAASLSWPDATYYCERAFRN